MEPCVFCGETKELTLFAALVAPAHLQTVVRCLTCRASGPPAESSDQAVANWNRRPASTLDPYITVRAAKGATINKGDMVVIASAPIDVRELRPGMISLDTPDLVEAARVLLPPGEADRRLAEMRADPGDDLSKARERRDLAGLPSVDAHVTLDGVEMDFDLGGPPPKKR